MKKRTLDTLGGVLLIGLVGLLWWSYRVNKDISTSLTDVQKELNDAKHTNAELSDALTNSQTELESFRAKVNDLTSTVGTLVKLKDTDPELLQKYSKVYFLSDNYVPKGLVPIETKYTLDKSRVLQFLSQAEPKLYSLLDAARSAGLDLYVDSAYRSFATQSGLKSSYMVTYGAGTANSFSADQGYSEHQLGTTVDFTTAKIGGALAGFDKTPEYAWLLANAYKYGFELSYPPNNPYYTFEPWHWRFVGVALATRLHEEKENFIDLEQRQIDPYLVNIFD